MSARRKPAALVCVDAAGYSALSERDQSNAAAAVGSLRGAVEAGCRAHGGRAFNRAGDGVMLAFTSAMDAVRFSLGVLRRLRAGPAVRVGMHMGEVIAEPDGDLLGHGVNVTARLCAMAEPRGVMISKPSVRPCRSGSSAFCCRSGRFNSAR